MSNISLIKGFYQDINESFAHVNLRLEIKEYSNTYVVDITPLDVYNNDKYIELEESFRLKFEELNPDASIVFVSENSILRADNAILNLLPSIDFAKEIKVDYNFNYNINNENYNNPYWGYALAA